MPNKFNILNFSLWMVMITILVSFLKGIIPMDFLHFSDNTYFIAGLSIALLVYGIKSFSVNKNLSVKIIRWEILLIALGIYMLLRRQEFYTLTFYYSKAANFALLLLLYFIVKHILISNKNHIHSLISGICFLTLFQILYGYLQLFNILPTNIGNFKFEGTLMNPSVFTNFITLGILICIGGFWFIDQYKYKIILLLPTIISGVLILIISEERTSWIAISIGTMYMAYYKFDLINLYRKMVNTTLKKCLIALLFILAGTTITILLYHYKADSSNGRILIWKICLQMIKENPVWGVGTDNFIYKYSYAQMEYLKNPSIDFSTVMLADRAIAAFNDYLQLTVTLGITGLLMFLTLVIFPVSKFSGNKKAKETLPFKAAILAVLIMALFSYPFKEMSAMSVVFLSLAAINSYEKNTTLYLFKRKVPALIFSFCLLALIIFINIKNTSYYISCRKWKIIHLQKKETVDKKKALAQYEALNKSLSKNFDFLYNYGIVLKYYGEYEKAIECLTISGKNYIDQNLLMDIAGCYYDMRMFDKAEIYCRDAADLVPYLFVPKYKLFLLYKEVDKHNEALKIAEEIYDMPIKIFSETVKQIKFDVKEYINNNK